MNLSYKNIGCIVAFILMGMIHIYAGTTQKDILEKKYPIIPTPQEIEYGKSEVSFKTFQIVKTDFVSESNHLKSFFQNNGISEASDGLKIQMIQEHIPVHNAEEAYKIQIDSEIKIWATTAKGAHYAIKTLQQVFRQQNDFGVIPQLQLTDWPAYKIRGFMHDTGRNFQSVAQLKEQLEVLSQYKYNVFHWHLTDDPGWRLESKLYPQLQNEDATSRGKGKFYTQDDFKEILAFCKARHITVIPEFDIPGHSRAFRNAMGFENMKDERALPVLLDLFDELMGLASADEMPYIHIGTDEVRNKEEYVPDGFIKTIMDRVKSKNRELIVWKEGIEIEEDSTSINQLWAQHSPRKGHRFIDSRANYINHLDPFAGMARLFFQQPTRQPQSDALALGGILAAWPDNNVAKERDILIQNPIYPSIVFYADAIWKGRAENKLEYWAKLPPVGSKELKEFIAFEDKVITHRDLFFKGKEFQYVRQTNFEWNVIGPFKHNGDVNLRFLVEDSLTVSYNIKGEEFTWSQPIVGGTTHFKHFFGFPALTTTQTGTFYAYTEMYSPDDRVQDFWVGFQGWSRSGGRRVGPFPDQGQWHTTNPKIWVNGTEIAPPVWKQPNLGTRTDEIPFIDEDYFFRAPTKIALKKGWNKVLLKVPQDKNSWKWMFTCVPIHLENGAVKEVDDLRFRAGFDTEPKVSVTEFPKDNQLYARDATNNATITVSGIADSSVDSILVKVHRDKGIITKHAMAVNGAFSIPIAIEALKHNYTIELFATRENEEYLIKKATHITAGDVYVLSGQSNAWAIDYDNVYNQESLSSNAQWVRTIGSMHLYNSPAIYPEAENSDWYIASGKAPDIVGKGERVGNGMVGVLGLNIGLNLVASQNVPIAIINGAGGGGAIASYQKNDYGLDAAYGRLQHKLEASGLKHHIKAFIWNQGESNAGDSVSDYKIALYQLYENLKSDYTFEKFYVVQTPPGCSVSSGHQTVREAQRQFAEEQSELKIITRHGFPENPLFDGNYFLSDGCHYHAHGYEVLADWISKLATYDFYNGTVDYQAPQLVSVTRESSKSLVIEFDKPIAIQPDLKVDGHVYSVKDQLFAINSKKITSISELKVHSKNPKKLHIILNGKRIKKDAVLTYILGDTYPNTSIPYRGPWVIDAQTKVGAVGFSAPIK
ncbi:family 20 glycosylhydrolase [Gelidibacter sp. F2691]|nr:family 20 glycosylhydrolase [Gelidibacter sp. F2691]